MLRRPRRLCPKSRYEKQIDSASRLVVKHRAHAWLSRCVSASIRTASTRDASVHSSRATGWLTPHRRMSMTSIVHLSGAWRLEIPHLDDELLG